MNGFKLLAAGLACCVSTISAAAVTVSHFETLERLDIAGPERAAAQQKTNADTSARVSFDAFGRTFDLRLEPNHRLLSDAARGSLPGALAAYRGGIDGNDGSWSRIVIADGLPRGLIWDGAEMYAVEVREEGAAPAAIIYRLADVYVPPGSMNCASAHATGNGAAVYDDLVGELGETMAKSSGARTQINIGAVGDYEFFQASGGGSTTAILTRLNNVDGIFSEQLGVRIVVQEVAVFTSQSDPFSDTADPNDLLDELAVYRNRTPRQREQGLTHLYTGRKLAGNTVGIAYTNTLCQASWGAGLTQSGSNVTFDSLVAAHEIGHNFGAPHDGESGSACATQGGSFIMATSINGSDQFSGCSIQQMQPNVQAASCLLPVPTIDPKITLSGSMDPVALGQSATATFTVANAGSGDASGVAVEISLPANVSLESAGASQGTCTSGAGTVSCTIGGLPGGSNRTVTITAAAVDTGNGEFAAAVFADVDDDPANNEAIAPFTVASETKAEAAPPAESAVSGGGGGSALPWLALMAFAGLSRRLRCGSPQPY
ncbi:MAG TPA: M12 family metallo-peptidase [Woeseiaceae bacterium]|nr:M12 family metallo-peptidase [Woeseiaceae bacterium]